MRGAGGRPARVVKVTTPLALLMPAWFRENTCEERGNVYSEGEERGVFMKMYKEMYNLTESEEYV